MHSFSRTKRLGISLLVGIFIFVNLFGLLFLTSPAKAGWPVTVVGDIPGQVKEVKLSFGKALLASALGALVHAASYFMRKLAYDTAMYVASGGKGQGALAFRQGAGAYFKEVALNSTADAIGELGKPFGLNLCQTPDLKVRVFMQIGLRSLYGPPEGGAGPQPKCTWQKMKDAWKPEAFEQKYGPGGSKFIAETFGSAIRVEESDFGIALGAMARLDRIEAQKVEGAKVERIEGQGFKPLTSLISGKIKTPSQVIYQETTAITAKQQSQLSAGQVAGIYGSGALQILPMAASVFLNTLTSQLLQKIMKGGLFGEEGEEEEGAGEFFAEYVQKGKKQAEQAFSFLFTAFPSKQLQSYDIVSEFAACDDNPGLNNCVIDTDFQRAIERAKIGSPLTIAEALKDGLLHADWPLISPYREVDNTDVQKCYLKHYCYSNIQKLRKARVLPLGFEIAALKADPDNPQSWSLGRVVAGFEDCAWNPNGIAYPDAQHPFCHLIDPNWIIKAPEARCEAEVIGPLLFSPDGAERRSECADISTRIKETLKENEYYSYCTKEKNIWRIGGQECPNYYNTCKTYFDRNNLAVSYLSRTLDYGECNLEAVGCRAYSAEKKDDKWLNSGQVSIGSGLVSLKQAGRPQILFFNDQIKNDACLSADAEGCSAFYPAFIANEKWEKSGTADYLKKAPDYLDCYDIDITTPYIDWPKTKPQLKKLSQSEECKKFAQACLPEEAGCEAYTPKDFGPTVPGIVGDNVCSAECVGYDPFKQEATGFEPLKFPLYFISSQGDKCQSVGCDEFTNIDAVAKGGEGLEYYTGLRYCEKPDGKNEKVFYSWEGSAQEGYVLRVHKKLQINETEASYISGLGLDLKIGDNINDTFGAGSPTYADDSKKALQANYDACNKDKYNKMINNKEIGDPNCAAMYDDAGHIYYRLLHKTVTVSADCHPLRKTESNLYVDGNLTTQNACEQKGGLWQSAQCQRCYSGGKYQNGSCVYSAITSESSACSAGQNGCRSYVGNIGNNVKIELFTFEPLGASADAMSKAKQGWSNGQVKPESTQVGLYSLEVVGETHYTFASGTIKTNEWYDLSFWARGNVQNLSIYFKQDNNLYGFTKNVLTDQDIKVSIGSEWREYRLGTIFFSGDSAKPVDLHFVSDVKTAYFLDNVLLRRVPEHINLIKESWKDKNNGFDVPLACDSSPDDSFPGQALGCRAYTDSHKKPVYATGFEKLCREDAVGCQPFYDSYNTLSEETMTAYNVWCKKENGPGKCALGGDLGSCEVKAGQKGCFVEKVVFPKEVNFVENVSNAKVVASTIIIPADTPTTTPIYLTNRQEFACQENHLGCQKVALEEKTLEAGGQSLYQFSGTHLLNNPDNYAKTLCTQDLVGCSEFRSGNEITYFKDPKIIGNSLCSYRSLVEIGGTKYSGWFKDGVGACEGKSALLCQKDVDCGSEGKCNINNPIPCYSDYMKLGSEYGIWSNKSEKYQGFVGICPVEQNGCAELVDPADPETSQTGPESVKGKAYYVIYNQDLQKKAGDCEGKVGLKEGCVLFDKTDQPNKLYNSTATYKDSEKASPKYSLVSPNTAEPKDSNLILKVDRDRECSEWLACKSATVLKTEEGESRNLCYEFQPCRRLGIGGTCGEWVDTQTTNLHPLTEDLYVARSTGWYDLEYSGYSLFNQYQIGDYVYFSFNKESGSNPFESYLAYEMDADLLKDNPKLNCEVSSGQSPDFKDGEKCGLGKGGRCYQGKCVYPLFGSFPSNLPDKINDDKMKNNLLPNVCKSYPEETSPYMQEIILNQSVTAFEDKVNPNNKEEKRKEFISQKKSFKEANVCQDGDCSCEYQRVSYKNGPTDFWPAPLVSSLLIPSKVCVMGDKDGFPCNDNNDCGAGGQCSSKEKEGIYYGQRGFCLEYDLSRPLGVVNKDTKFACLTWLPIDMSASGIDNYNYFEGAGYLPSKDAQEAPGEVYCTRSTAHGLYTYDKDVFTSIVDFNNPPYKETNESTYNAFKNDKGGSEVAHPFDWMKKTSNSSLMNKNVLYSYLQLYGWYGLKKPNAIVWYVGDPKAWSDVLLYSKVSDSPEYVISEDRYEQDIRRLYFAPFAYHQGIFTCVAPSYYIVDNFYIDFEGLKMGKEQSTSYSATPYTYEKRTTKDATGSKDVTYYTFRGKVEYANDTQNTDNGRIRYGIIVDQKPGIPENIIKDNISYFLNHTSVVWDDDNIQRVERYIDFDAQTGKLLDIKGWSGGYKYVGSCTYGKNWSDALGMGFPSLGMIMELKPRCTEFTGVYKKGELTTNKAYTNRVWEYAPEELNPFVNYNKKVFRINYSTSPFGPLTLSYNDLSNNSSKMRNYYFDDPKADGYPLSCGEKLFGASTYGSRREIIGGAWHCDALLNNFNQTQPYQTINNNFLAQLYIGGTSDDVFPTGAWLLSNFFAKAFQISTRAGGESDFALIKTWDNSGNQGVLGNEAGGPTYLGPWVLAPQIYSLNPYRCFYDKSSGCVAGEKDNITVNEKNGTLADYNGDGKLGDEDLNNNEEPDYLYRVGSYFAKFNFFAFADDNRMPLKRVMVNWGDDSAITNENRIGMYKNHKPICLGDNETTQARFCYAKGSNISSQLICDDNLTCPSGMECKEPDNQPHFGSAFRACTPGYFEFTHDYTCGKDDKKNNKPWAKNISELSPAIQLTLKNMGATSDWVCLFTPKVQVLDNWGWCNGQCDNNGDGKLEEGCWNDGKKPSGEQSPQCNLSVNAWTPFKGQIIVIPS